MAENSTFPNCPPATTPAESAAYIFTLTLTDEIISCADAFQSVFAPPHHGSLSTKVKASAPASKQSQNIPVIGPSEFKWNGETADCVFTHFPIVTTDKFALFIEQSDVFQGFYYSGLDQASESGTTDYLAPKIIPYETVALSAGSPFAGGFQTINPVIFTQGDPQPVALAFKADKFPSNGILQYVVTRA